jgi:hypothetical protein
MVHYLRIGDALVSNAVNYQLIRTIPEVFSHRLKSPSKDDAQMASVPARKKKIQSLVFFRQFGVVLK